MKLGGIPVGISYFSQPFSKYKRVVKYSMTSRKFCITSIYFGSGGELVNLIAKIRDGSRQHDTISCN